MMDENQISKIIVVAAVEVHRTLGGPGLLESAYEEALHRIIGGSASADTYALQRANFGNTVKTRHPRKR